LSVKIGTLGQIDVGTYVLLRPSCQTVWPGFSLCAPAMLKDCCQSGFYARRWQCKKLFLDGARDRLCAFALLLLGTNGGCTKNYDQ
jgi:hypothetical protein